MITLQRSSCSFRRQGSSGRIWQDMQFMEPKSGSLSTKNQVNEENVSQNGTNIVVGRRNNENTTVANSAPSPRNNQNKVHRGLLSSFCGICMHSPPIRD
ncbi:unnamed protein product [Lathyrus sativus]|nr:unnamed protein product [Lathyrus sativus]